MAAQDDQGEGGRAGRPIGGPMQGLLGGLCAALEQGVAPLRAPIGKLVTSLGRSPRGARAVLAPLRRLADQFALLVDEVAEQQA